MILIEKSTWNEPSHDRFISLLGPKAFVVERTPFTTEFVPEPPAGITHCFGSSKFIQVCRERKLPVFNSYGPLDFLVDPHNYLNEGWVCDADNIDFRHETGVLSVFVKPFEEKLFTGTVLEIGETLENRQHLGEIKGTKVLVSPYQQIYKEFRFFCSPTEVIAGSLYRQGHRIKYERIYPRHDAWRFVEQFEFGEYNVCDVALTKIGYQIIEHNNFNSSGFYECDLARIINKL